MDINKLALLTNELGGYDEVERVIGVDAGLVQKAVETGRITHRENAELETAFNQLYLYPEIAEDEGLDVEYLFGTGERDRFEDIDNGFSEFVIQNAGALEDRERINLFRKALAEQRINPDDLDTSELLFNDGYATPHIQNNLLGWLTEERYDRSSFDRWLAKDHTDRRRENYTKWLHVHPGANEYVYLTTSARARNAYNKWFGEGERNAKDFLNRFANDGYTLFGEEMLDSEFWQWYRETFY